MNRMLCKVPPTPVRPVPETSDPRRASLIRMLEKKWVNGSVIKYHFLKDPGVAGSAKFEDIVRKGWQTWKDQGIGLQFEEVADRQQSDCRIGFVQGDGSWSYIGRDILEQPKSERTLNLGWDISRDNDAVIHEIGHTLGLPHEHQNPNAGA
jgi:Astacin (Peptidase family M12A)